MLLIFQCAEDEFRRYCGSKAPFPNLTLRALKEPIVPSEQNLKADQRYGAVFV